MIQCISVAFEFLTSRERITEKILQTMHAMREYACTRTPYTSTVSILNLKILRREV